MNSDSWKNLFAAAMQQIKQSGLPPSMWTFGGGHCAYAQIQASVQ